MASSSLPPPQPPHLTFLYRIEADMSPTPITIGSPFGGSHTRIIMSILGGTLRGPGLAGEILEHGGADWGTSIKGTDFMRLNARYTIRMETGEHIFVSASGGFGPPAAAAGADEPAPFDHAERAEFSREDVEWFTTVRIEAGEGRYNWLNSCVIVGALTMVQRKIVIEAWRVTNFPEREPRSFKALV